MGGVGRFHRRCSNVGRDSHAAYRRLTASFGTLSSTCSAISATSIRRAKAVPGDLLTGIDAWILMRCANLVRQCTAWYNEYAFHKVYRAIYDFAITDLSAIYFDVSKDQAVYSVSVFSCAAKRSNGASSLESGAGTPAGARSSPSRAKKSGVTQNSERQIRRASIWITFRAPKT